MTDRDREKVRDVNAALKELLLRHMEKPGARPSAVEGLTLVRQDAAHCSEKCFSQPLAAVLVQGVKHTAIGVREYHIQENQCLVSGVDMPSSSCSIAPTPERPFLSLFFHLDKRILTDLLTATTPQAFPSSQEGGAAAALDPGPGGWSVSVADADPEFMEGVLRLARLLDKPEQIPVRAPLILRELHYLLLIGPQGSVLRELHRLDSQNNQIMRAISLLRHDVAKPWSVRELAWQVNMSVSSLHRHFKIVTGFSPLQYHKQLRLYEAQRLMLERNESASSAALAVGYKSVTQFNREYKRLFGEPPGRDMHRRRGRA